MKTVVLFSLYRAVFNFFYDTCIDRSSATSIAGHLIECGVYYDAIVRLTICPARVNFQRTATSAMANPTFFSQC